MPKLTVDGIEVEVAPGETVLQACEAAGVEIPRFCYHERLSIAGNCRMCLVEVEKSPKPVASCAMPAGEGMVVRTTTPTVQKARHGVMEFLLLNHPLDCPICDQGGECDLQDQAMAYGFDRSRYREAKRAVEDKYLGPLVKTIMTRCIHCTRCVRFASEIAGVDELGAIGRGEDMEITTYLEKAMTSELSANVIDLCPVGALTSKPYAFKARPWELKKTETVDVMDALGSAIRIDSRGRAVMRALPRVNDDINEEWISDKTRYAVDGLERQRLDTPYVRRDGRLHAVSWDEAFDAVAARLKGVPGTRLAAIAGDLACLESLKALKDLMGALGSPHLDSRQDGTPLGGARGGYLFNSTIEGIDRADALLLIGTNPRREAAVLNARIRRRWLSTGLPIAAVGCPVDLTYTVDWLGAGPATLAELAEGKLLFSKTLANAGAPMIVLGQGALARPDGAAVLSLAASVGIKAGVVRSGWNGFNILHNAAARVGGLDIGFLPKKGGRDMRAILDGAFAGEFAAVFLLNADEIDMSRLGSSFVIYIGTHGDAGAHRADVILPGAAYTEKNALWVNTEGRVQQGKRAVFPPGEAREDWKILRALSAVLGKTLPYDSDGELRAAIIADAPHVSQLDTICIADMSGVLETLVKADKPADAPFILPIPDFYLTNPIARASTVMAQCSALAASLSEATGTHG
jgi:NADH-quinone oxidoreductase subunit G